ncbi:hypothetical protein [Amycolatopsis sp. lyj-112]|uniref:hypothetical protein n=1 Tax=Amycolatopsis sp. lyj-112 TaxID=2789288 RepID=UPI00397D161A
MTSIIHHNQRVSMEKIVGALESTPPRIRTALTELRHVFTNGTEQPPAILTACAALLKTDRPVTPDILGAVRTAHAAWDSYGELERKLYNRCVFSTESRHDIVATEPNDITVMLHATPPRIKDAANALRWLNAATQDEHRHAYIACESLLSNPSADHPAIVEAIQTGYKLWPSLNDQNRALFMACVYASKERARIARARTEKRQKHIEAETPDESHRCGSCDGNLASTPDLPYCSDACRREAEAAQRPAPQVRTATAARPTADKRAQERFAVGELEQQFDEHYRAIVRAIPSAGVVRKDERAVDAYERERMRQLDHDDTRDAVSDLTGFWVSDQDHERLALRAIITDALCAACNIERTPAEYRDPDDDGRCAECLDRDRVPLDVIRREIALAAQRPNPAHAIVDTLYGLDAVDVLRNLQASPHAVPALAAA